MAVLGARHDNEQNSYALVNDNGTNQVAQRTKPVGAGSILEGIVYDYIGFDYPNATTEVYTYKTGGSGGTTVATITAIYTDATKDFLSSVERS